jgi:tRNA A58 N-methylase Trm61
LDQARIEAELNLVLLNIAEIQEAISDGVERLREEGKLTMEFEKMVQNVMREVDGWTDQCTATAETPPVLLRRMQVQMERLRRIERLIEDLGL